MQQYINVLINHLKVIIQIELNFVYLSVHNIVISENLPLAQPPNQNAVLQTHKHQEIQKLLKMFTIYVFHICVDTM